MACRATLQTRGVFMSTIHLPSDHATRMVFVDSFIRLNDGLEQPRLNVVPTSPATYLRSIAKGNP
jgi:hypothetical protein